MKARKIVAYLAHPIGPGSTPEDLDRRQDNIAGALAWLQWLVDHTSWSVNVPWLPYVQRLDENTYRLRGIEDDLAVLERCDVIVLAGGRVSPGMVDELTHAKTNGIPHVDLTSWGPTPPALPVDSGRAVVALREYNAFRARARRVWLPPISKGDLDSLRALRLASGPHAAALPDAASYLSTIIDAATAP